MEKPPNPESFDIRKFNVESINNLSLETTNTFSKVFESEGYLKHTSYPSLISEIDHSVRFIGSTTNVFKQYLKENNLIPERGYFLIQKCLRTRNTNTLFDDSIIPEWSSYFTAMGAIAPANALNKLSNTTLEFLIESKIDINRIKINVSSKDKDLLECVEKIKKNFKCQVGIDEINNLEYYRHKYGEQNLQGRNFNISIKNQKTNEFKDIGNIILIEKDNIPTAVEMGIGVGTLISKKFDLNNSIEASSISKIIPYKPDLTSKFSDALSVSVVMFKEKIIPGSRDKARLLRTNLLALTYFKHKIGLNLEEIKKYIDLYEKEEFNEITNISDRIIPYLIENDKRLPNTTYDFNWGKNN
jgi:hypothetical protein